MPTAHVFPFRLRDLRSPATTQRLSLGCPLLDALVGGGIPVGCLTEVVGKSREKDEEEERGGAIERNDGNSTSRPRLSFQKKKKKKKKARPPRARPNSASACSSPRSSPKSWEGSTARLCGSARRRATPPFAGWPSSQRARAATAAPRARPPLQLLLLLLLLPRTPPLRPTTSL